MSKQIAERKPDQTGRCCAICGYGQSQQRGALLGCASNLRAAGYTIPRNIVDGVDRGEKMLFAHLKCLQKAQKAAAFEARLAKPIW